MSKNEEYIMGIDPYGFDGKTGSICVMKRVVGTVDATVEYLNSFRNEMDYEKEVERLVELYQIPDKNILKQEK